MRGIVVVAQLKKKIPIYWLKPTKEKKKYINMCIQGGDIVMPRRKKENPKPAEPMPNNDVINSKQPVKRAVVPMLYRATPY